MLTNQLESQASWRISCFLFLVSRINDKLLTLTRLSEAMNDRYILECSELEGVSNPQYCRLPTIGLIMLYSKLR